MNMNRQTWLLLLLATIFLLISTTMLALLLREHGARLLVGDSFTYAQTAMHLAQGEGLNTTRYTPHSDVLTTVPTTHYPPLFPAVYAALIAVGWSPAAAIALLLVVGWVVFLAGIGVLTYRLGRSLPIAVLAILLATFTYGFWYVFQSLLSEALFLPLLVWTMAVVVDLPTRTTRQYGWLVVAACLLALLMLTRYTGVLVFGAVVLWWVGWHIYHGYAQAQARAQAQAHAQRSLAGVVGGTLMLLAAALPSGGWSVYNSLRQDSPLGAHTAASEHSFQQGIIALMKESTQVFLPSLHIRDTLRDAPAVLLVLYLVAGTVVVFFAARLFLRWYRHHHQHRHAQFPPLRSPILPFLLFYVLLYTVAQPFLSFWPIDMRDMTTILCLIHPWMFGVVAHLPPRRSYALAASYVLLNAALAIGPLVLNGLPGWVHLVPPRTEYVVTEDISTPAIRGPGMAGWLVTRTPHTLDIARHHPALDAWLRASPLDRVILTNEPMLFTTYQHLVVEHISEPYSESKTSLTAWVERGRCTSRHTVSILIFDWAYLAEGAEGYQQYIEHTCPDLPRTEFKHSVLYELSATRSKSVPLDTPPAWGGVVRQLPQQSSGHPGGPRT